MKEPLGNLLKEFEEHFDGNSFMEEFQRGSMECCRAKFWEVFLGELLEVVPKKLKKNFVETSEECFEGYIKKLMCVCVFVWLITKLYTIVHSYCQAHKWIFRLLIENQ